MSLRSWMSAAAALVSAVIAPVALAHLPYTVVDLGRLGSPPSRANGVNNLG